MPNSEIKYDEYDDEPVVTNFISSGSSEIRNLLKSLRLTVVETFMELEND